MSMVCHEITEICTIEILNKINYIVKNEYRGNLRLVVTLQCYADAILCAAVAKSVLLVPKIS